MMLKATGPKKEKPKEQIASMVAQNIIKPITSSVSNATMHLTGMLNGTSSEVIERDLGLMMSSGLILLGLSLASLALFSDNEEKGQKDG